MSGSAVYDIARQACIFMEVTPISSLDDDSELAQALASQFGTARDACLETADWSFASRMVQLSELDATSLGNFVTDPDLPHAYGLPADCLRIHEVFDCAHWRIDSDTLRADIAAPLRLRYTSRIENETRFPAEFRMAIAYRLAHLLAPRFTSTQSKVNDLAANADNALRRAARNHARDASPARYDGQPDQGDWVTLARQ